MKKTAFSSITALLLSLLSLFSCSGSRTETSRTKIALGTFVQINIISGKSEIERAEQSIKSVYKKIEEYEKTKEGFVLGCQGKDLSKDEIYKYEFKVKK